jgi:hypothetical protein
MAARPHRLPHPRHRAQWYADSLVCQRGADNVAQCSGSSRNAYGNAVTWTVNLHKLD